ncbi:putative G1/S-specific cyclin-D3 [Hypsibius exemplaris]|uniref:G1/S-specific cyclin-D3 n=1 Tax=Hypsibius exemplaris TaxID=2072580 RepID=A0A1W0XCL2_HYPEX|nr:putative G1/S-specific cyclin-D3 [Hypsibius exemplaris]
MAAAAEDHVASLVCLENVNYNARVLTQPQTNRPNPWQVTRVLCKHEADYLPRAAATQRNGEPPNDPNYLSASSCAIVKPHMREMLGLWMCQVCAFREADLFPSAISVCDRFLARFNLTSDDQIQLVGAASLHLASKLRETEPMTTSEVLYYTDDSYSVDNMRDIETIILDTLQFDLISVTPGHFLDAFITILQVPVELEQSVKTDALRRINMALIGNELLSVRPSVIAASCLVASLSSASLPVDGALFGNLCQAMACEPSYLVSCMNKSIEAWTKHYAAVYEAGLGSAQQKAADQDTDDDDEEDSDNDADSEDEEDSDVEMDEGLVIDCSSKESRGLPGSSSSSDVNDYLMDSDSGIQEDFMSDTAGADRQLGRLPSEYYCDSDNDD